MFYYGLNICRYTGTNEDTAMRKLRLTVAVSALILATAGTVLGTDAIAAGAVAPAELSSETVALQEKVVALIAQGMAPDVAITQVIASLAAPSNQAISALVTAAVTARPQAAIAITLAAVKAAPGHAAAITTAAATAAPAQATAVTNAAISAALSNVTLLLMQVSWQVLTLFRLPKQQAQVLQLAVVLHLPSV